MEWESPSLSLEWPLSFLGWGSTAGFTWYLTSGIVRYELVYGSLGAIVVLMFWVYISSLIIIYPYLPSSSLISHMPHSQSHFPCSLLIMAPNWLNFSSIFSYPGSKSANRSLYRESISLILSILSSGVTPGDKVGDVLRQCCQSSAMVHTILVMTKDLNCKSIGGR